MKYLVFGIITLTFLVAIFGTIDMIIQLYKKDEDFDNTPQ